MPIVDWFRPKWKRSDPNVRRQAATAMTDQRKLAVLAQEDVDVNVRAAAVKRLNNVEILTAIALSEVNGVISSTAMAGGACGCRTRRGSHHEW